MNLNLKKSELGLMNHRLILLFLGTIFPILGCRESVVADSVGNSHSDSDRPLNQETANSESKNIAVLALKNVGKDEGLEEIGDLATFLNKHSPSKGRSKLRKVFARSKDRVNLIQNLLNNYSGENPLQGASQIAMSMYQWPGQMAQAIMGTVNLEFSDKERVITMHASAQLSRKNQKGLTDMYSVLDPGGIRTQVAGKMAYLSYKESGIESALSTVSALDFQVEKERALNHILFQIQSQYVAKQLTASAGRSTEITFSSDDRQLVEEFIAEWDHTEKLQERLDEIEQYQSSSDNGR